MPAPYIMIFGPWSPDLQNVGIQLPQQWAGTPFPCADCLNVFYQDACYRSIPGLASIGPTLGAQALNATTWYDDSTNTEEIFAATASSISVLAGGSWSQVPIQLNSTVSQAGVLVSIILGTASYLSLSPGSQLDSDTVASFALSPSTVSGAPPGSTFVWSLGSFTGTGTWSILSGQGTATATAFVSGVPAGTTTTAVFQCAVTSAGNLTDVTTNLSYGYMTGSISGSASGSAMGTVTTNSVTANESAGVGSITYSWTAPVGVTINSPSSATTTFSASTSVAGTIGCTITDANGTQVIPLGSLNITSYVYLGSVTSAVIFSGAAIGYASGQAGSSITPTTDKNSYAIDGLYWGVSANNLTLFINASGLASNYFTTLTIAGTPFSASAASFVGGSTAQWVWSSISSSPLSGTQSWSLL